MNKNSKDILIFLLITFIFSYALEFYVVFNGGVKAFGFFLLTGLMWIPGLVSIVQRLVQKSGFGDVGLRLERKVLFDCFRGHICRFIYQLLPGSSI